MSPADSPLVNEYRRLTPGSAALATRARQVFPSGVTHDGRFVQPYGIYSVRAAGSRKWDVDGREYVDYAGGHGALLLGHNHPDVVQAIAAQVPLGSHYGSGHELEIRWGESVQHLIPSAERVRFTSSGTEATLLALRLARAFTGKSKILRFKGHFHGWHDHMAFGVYSRWDGTPSPGVLPAVAENVVLGTAGDLADTRRLLDEHPDIAAVIIEPTGASWGQVPVLPEFLEGLREATESRGVLLIFDEVITGFRVSPGGAQAQFGIKPDMTTLAKILAGGMPGGAVAGRRDVLDQLDHLASAAEDREKISHHGTFNANPVSAAAGIATLEIVAEQDVCGRANDYAARLREALGRVVHDQRVPWSVYGAYSAFHIFTNPENLPVRAADIESGKCDHQVIKSPAAKSLLMKLRLGMLVNGVEIFSWPGGPTSAVHTDEDLEITAAAFERTLKALREEGEIPQ